MAIVAVKKVEPEASSAMPSSDPAPLLTALMSQMKGKDLSSIPNPEYDDSRMVKHSLKSIARMAVILERMACECGPMPSWAEAKIYTASKDLQTVLGSMLGR
jgi:hypothetical protein